MANIGFIGLGNMGTPMAANLVNEGFEVCGFDLLKANIDAAVARGVTAVGSAPEAAKHADIVMTMLPAGKDTLTVWGEAGTLSAAQQGTLFIDCSTIDVASAKQAHAMANEAGMLSIDAPVSGGIAGAEAATLTLMVGGSSAAFQKAKPVLEKIGSNVIHCGDDGMGQAAKICNNMMLGINMIATSEAFVLAENLGLSKQAVFDVVSTSSGQTWAINNHCPVPGPVPTSAANNKYKPGFTVALMSKDLSLSQEAARGAGAVSPMGANANQLFRLYAACAAESVDYTSIVKFIRGKLS
jgi:3-hydroxyisobutyrate dehydrogenase